MVTAMFYEARESSSLRHSKTLSGWVTKGHLIHFTLQSGGCLQGPNPACCKALRPLSSFHVSKEGNGIMSLVWHTAPGLSSQMQALGKAALWHPCVQLAQELLTPHSTSATPRSAQHFYTPKNPSYTPASMSKYPLMTVKALQ